MIEYTNEIQELEEGKLCIQQNRYPHTQLNKLHSIQNIPWTLRAPSLSAHMERV